MSAGAQYPLCLPPRTPEQIEEDRRAKAVAKAAFLAYEAAVRSGDADLAEAARVRFNEASAVLAGKRGAT